MDEFEIIDHSLSLGKCFILKSTWQSSYANIINKEGVSILRLSTSAGWRGTDLAFLKDITTLKGVEIYNWDVHDLTPLYAISGLEILSVDVLLKIQIDIGRFPNLKVFMCTNSPKIKNLEQCENLEYLNITNYPYESFSEISRLKQLKRIFISSRKLNSFKGVAGLEKLEILDLYDCRKLLSLEEIQTAKNLRHIEITSCTKFSDISPLGQLSNLHYLKIENCGPIETIRCLKSCQNLESLFIIGNKPIVDGDLSVIKELPHLENISLARKRHYNLSSDQILSIINHKKRN